MGRSDELFQEKEMSPRLRYQLRTRLSSLKEEGSLGIWKKGSGSPLPWGPDPHCPLVPNMPALQRTFQDHQSKTAGRSAAGVAGLLQSFSEKLLEPASNTFCSSLGGVFHPFCCFLGQALLFTAGGLRLNTASGGFQSLGTGVLIR